jgi:glycosyltransferase involved in cell wall biosynthesis
MSVTVAICTFNRAESLRRCLNSLAAMRVPSGLAWELIIVNNNSTDHTDDVVEEYRDRLPLRREFEPRHGLSNARNRAIDTAKGEYIVWTDDDVVVDSDWLTAYVEAFRRWPDAAVYGGRIKPRYEPPVARWIEECESLVDSAFAIRDFGNEVQPLSVAEGRIPFGANFAVRLAEQRVFRYDPELGLAPNRRRGGDEIDVVSRLLMSGAKGYWLPEAKVEHCIGRERQTILYIGTYYEGFGETCAFRDAAVTAAEPFWFGIPRRIWPRLVLWWVLYRFCVLVSPAPVWVRYLKAYSYNKGVFRYWRQQRIAMQRTPRVETGA